MKINIIDGVWLKKALKGAVGLLEKKMEEVNSLNVFPVPDGDTGTNMLLTIKSALKEGLKVEENDASKVALAASKGSLMGARGNSGVILSQLFRGFANGLDSRKEIDKEALAQALMEAANTAYKAVMKPTEGTILTVARQMGEYAMVNFRNDKELLDFTNDIIEAGQVSLDNTPELLAVLKQAGVVDAGGKGLLYILMGSYNVLASIDHYDEEPEKVEVAAVDNQAHHIDSQDIKFGYCTEFLINTDYSDLDKFRDDLASQGDSLMVVGGDGIIKVHVHTNNPGLALEKALKLGELSDIKIDNMRYQHEEVLFKEEMKASSQKELVNEVNKKYAFVSVSIGEGIDEVFKELGVDYIVSGGQTMNPSTEDIVKAIESTKGENVFILPNNGNIILAAKQAKELSDRNVIVLPSKSIPQGISALIDFDEDESVEDNEATMLEAISYLKSGQITFAVRDTEYNNTHISKDDIIGLADGEIVAAGKDIKDIAVKTIDEMMDEDRSFISLLYGEDVSQEEAEEFAEFLESKYEDFDIEVIYGGQPLYYYLISLE